jgi:hypothetical protein
MGAFGDDQDFMKDRLLLWWWQARLPAAEVERRRSELRARKFAYHLQHTSALGTPPLSFKERLQIIGLFAILFSFVLLMAWLSSHPH